MHIIQLTQEHLPIVARWIFNAFWQDSGQTVSYLEGLLAEHLAGKPIPTTFVAVQDGSPIGSVSFIESDMAERPTLTPWLAALYVQPPFRKRGIGSQLVGHLVNHAAKAGFSRIYLSADDQVPLYGRLGFKIIETDVGSHKLTIMQQTITP